MATINVTPTEMFSKNMTYWDLLAINKHIHTHFAAKIV